MKYSHSSWAVGAMVLAVWTSTVWAQAAVDLNAALGAGSAERWAITAGAGKVEADQFNGAAVLTAEQAMIVQSLQSVPAGSEIRALLRVRLPVGGGAWANLVMAAKVAQDPALQFNLSFSQAAGLIGCSVAHNGKPLHNLAELTKTLDWHAQNANEFAYHVRAYQQFLPGWAPEYRSRIESDMAELPTIENKWLTVRAQLGEGWVRLWVDDRLVATKHDPQLETGGLVRLHLPVNGQLAKLEIRPIVQTPGFVPLEIAGYLNGRRFVGSATLADDAIPNDQVVQVGQVPFVFSGVNVEGKDHLDIGRSFLREANSAGYLQSNGPRFIGATKRDPARIQLRVPNGVYDRLHVIAAAEKLANHPPVLSAMFYRPGAGFAQTFEANVPLAEATSSEAVPMPVTLSDGKKVNLWLVTIPLDRGMLSSFADMDIVEIELTKKVHQWRSYPDPISYGYHQGGLPSPVHVYAVTLGESPVTFEFKPDVFGHVWTAPAVPSYTATVANRTAAPMSGKLTVAVKSYDGSESKQYEQPVQIAADASAALKFSLPVKLNGYHDVVATLEIGGQTWVESRSMVRLNADTRSVQWTPGRGALYGFWTYAGGHHSAKNDHQFNLMIAAGARTAIGYGHNRELPSIQKHFWKIPAGAWEVGYEAWAEEEPVDPAKIADFKQRVVQKFTDWRKNVPERFLPDHVYFYPEPHVSLRLTAGNFPEYWNGEPYEYTEDEKRRLRGFMVLSQAAAEAVRGAFPGLKILIPWGDPGFAIPLLRAGFSKNLIDGSGLDICHFERLPEMQLHQISFHRLYELKNEYKKAGIDDPLLQFCEGPFVPTEVGACTWREQMDIYTRCWMIAQAYGVDRFYSSFFAFDCTDYYGAEHYGGCGIQRKVPYCDPKPAYASYAAMTRNLNEANFDGWEKTGSLTTFCLRFKKADDKGFVYTLWTLRGTRPVTITLASDGDVTVVDSMDNARTIASQNGTVTIPTDASVIYVSAPNNAAIKGVAVGTPDYSDQAPAGGAVQVADLGDGSWQYTSQRDIGYETNGFGIMRYLGKFAANVIDDASHGKVLESQLLKQDIERQLMPWYNTLAPAKPIVIAGAPSHVGLWVRGASDWGRVIYVLRDAKGEKWTSIGAKDDYNCDDVHSWSSFNFDGWRYLRFELPGHLGWDNYRRHGTTWWKSDDGDGVIDLPLSLEQIIVEQRSHILYVNDVQPVASDRVAFGKMFIEYASPEDATEEAIRLSRLRMPMPAEVPNLPNPIAEFAANGVGAPVSIAKLVPPEHYADGTRVHVHFTPAANAKSHHLWVSAHADGRGAVNLTPGGLAPGQLVYGLRPGIPLYYWLVYADAEGKLSKPSAAHKEILIDMFKEK